MYIVHITPISLSLKITLLLLQSLYRCILRSREPIRLFVVPFHTIRCLCNSIGLLRACASWSWKTEMNDIRTLCTNRRAIVRAVTAYFHHFHSMNLWIDIDRSRTANYIADKLSQNKKKCKTEKETLQTWKHAWPVSVAPVTCFSSRFCAVASILTIQPTGAVCLFGHFFSFFLLHLTSGNAVTQSNFQFSGSIWVKLAYA